MRRRGLIALSLRRAGETRRGLPIQARATRAGRGRCETDVVLATKGHGHGLSEDFAVTATVSRLRGHGPVVRTTLTQTAPLAKVGPIRCFREMAVTVQTGSYRARSISQVCIVPSARGGGVISRAKTDLSLA